MLLTFIHQENPNFAKSVGQIPCVVKELLAEKFQPDLLYLGRLGGPKDLIRATSAHATVPLRIDAPFLLD